MDLVMLAAWEAHTVTIKGKLYTLERGDLAASVRFLARRWRWGLGKTVSFLARLRVDEMLIKKVNGSGNGSPSVFQVVNYDTYNSDDSESRNGSRNAGGTVAERLRNETKKLKKGKKNLTTSPAVAVALNGNSPEAVWGTPEALAALYNQLIPPGHPQATTLSDGRRVKLARALSQFPDRDFWEGAFREIGQSPLLRGRVPSLEHKRFRGDLDWLCATGKDGIENALKVSEGRYRDACPQDDDDDDAA